MASVRPAAVAGSFYPASRDALLAQLDGLLQEAAAPVPQNAAATPTPKAIIAPHAGYVYSGPTAARIYARLARARDTIRRVVLLGPVHRVPVKGLAMPSVDAFATPLGTVPLDTAALAGLRDLPQIVVSDPAHALEHSLEVHLPFLQRILGRFTLIPLAVGDASPEDVAVVLERVWGGDETLIVVSSDLSHYQPYARAVATDRATVDTILALKQGVTHRQACGGTPVNALTLVAKRHGLAPELVDLRNSGDTAGDRVRVVGYASIAFVAGTSDPAESGTRTTAAPAASGQDPRGPVLLAHARAAIERALGMDTAIPPEPDWLAAQGATFVTLTQRGHLRGCIGSLAAYRPLGADVRENAVSAALRDPRFPCLSRDELAITTVEVSLLTAPAPFPIADEADAIARLRPGIDGVILEHGSHRATFLPQVWESLPDPRLFLAELKRKAGLPPAFRDPGLRLATYQAEKWKEPELVWVSDLPRP
jgi:AmmeMemoRadiSam system protein B/AmmeMemoRadiSam system protein A